MMTLMLAVSCPLTAMAQQSPEMARTAEQWASLRDNSLEYGELADLVHEYNPTVLANASSYKGEKNQSSTDVAQSYYEAAGKISDSLSEPDPDDANYAMAMSSYLNAQIQYENLMEKADTNTNDSETIRLQYEKTEAETVKQAQSLMISYWTQKANIDSLEANLKTARENAASAANKAAAGTALSASVDSANQQLTQAQASLDSARSSLEATREKLILMLGWPYNADVNIGQVPSVSDEQIAAISLAEDIEKAKANNYSYRTTSRQYDNASATTKEKLGITKSTAEQNISNNVTSLYNALLLAQSAYTQAAGSTQIQKNALDTAARKLKAGLLTQKAYDQTAAALSSSDASLEAKRLALVSAYNDYWWAVNGLASN